MQKKYQITFKRVVYLKPVDVKGYFDLWLKNHIPDVELHSYFNIDLEKRLWTKEELLEEYERIKNIPLREDITLTPETLFYMFEAIREQS